MSTPAELARQHTDLGPADLGHLQGLMAWWGVLADLCFADLLLLVPSVRGGEGEGRAWPFVILGQMRPSTTQTLYDEDLVGRVTDEVSRPLVARAWRLGEIVEGEIQVARSERARSQCIPVRRDGRLLAVLTREATVSVRRKPGELERVYVALFDRFARMIVEGLFPFAGDVAEGEESPRVGDGVVVLDEGARVVYSSPNAVNAFHRMGVTTNAEGLRLAELGLDDTAVARSFVSGLPVTEEVERWPDVAALLRCIPLLAGGRVDGALVLLRDVTDLRRRDRLLLSKDATIREVHHRVKNNLQTISSLLRLQARRLGSEEGRHALREAERRIRSMAAVHEILSRDVGDQVPFDQIVPLLVRMAEDAVLSARPVRVEVAGHAGDLRAEVATTLAVVITELLQNAVEHAFMDADGDGRAEVVGGAPAGPAAHAEPAR
ncbi:MAG: sensor histidine kinase, partial [Acidimicrobiales bacterium]